MNNPALSGALVKNTAAKVCVLVFVASGTIVLSNQARAVPIGGLFNTGVDGTGAVLPYGSADPHYVLTGPLSGAIVIHRRIVSSNNQWVEPPAGSAWIGPQESDQPSPVGAYLYTLKFNLAGFDPATAVITGGLAADNTPQIFINGLNTGFTHPNQYKTLENFIITNGFVSGTNSLEFWVTNNPSAGGVNPTGLLVANLAGTVQPRPTASIRVSGVSEVALCWPAVSNRLYGVEYRSALTSSTWVTLFTNIVGNGGVTCIDDKITNGMPQRFYRIVCPTQ